MKAPQKARKQNDNAPMLVGVYRSPSAHSCRSSSSSSSPLSPLQAKCNLWQRSAKYKWLGDATVTAKTATATMAGEVKQQSIKVSDYRRGTPECLPSMPLCWIAGLSDCWIALWPDDRQKG
ncbi:GD23757 [Drosophila simulans]|uniref:GD23757 n=1 Tax=Drosophila simulans TaxID=7240 RepID=B4QAA0_DROSI|nr:GD23757 [Drosophila simulans]